MAATSGAEAAPAEVAPDGAAASFLSAAVVWSAAAEADCAATPSLALPVASLAFAAIGAGAGARALEFGLRVGVRAGTLLLRVFLVGLSAIANPVSGVLAVCAAVVMAASDEMAGAVSSVEEAGVGAAFAAVELPDMELPGVELPAGESLILGSLTLESLTLESVDLGTAACCALTGAMAGAKLPSLTRDGSGGTGVGIGVGPEDVSGMILGAEFAGGTGVEL